MLNRIVTGIKVTDTHRSLHCQAFSTYLEDTKLFSHLKTFSVQHLPLDEVSNTSQEPCILFPKHKHTKNMKLTKIVVTTIVLFSTDEVSLEGS